MRFALALCLAVAAVGCESRTTTAQARFFQDGSQKPTVAIVPLFDNTAPNVDWDLSEELTESIHYRLQKKDKVFLTSQQKVKNLIRNLRNSQNPFAVDIAWVKPAFAGQDFVVFMELLQHEEKSIKSAPQEDPQLCPAELNISLRVRVIDVRGETPKVVLQEIIRQSEYLPRQFNQYNFHQQVATEDAFTFSPLGLAHSQLTKEAAKRIEEYILLARN